MEKMKLVKNGLVLDSQKGFEVNDILIAGGKIAKIGKNIEVSETDYEVLNAEGFYVVPDLLMYTCMERQVSIL